MVEKYRTIYGIIDSFIKKSYDCVLLYSGALIYFTIGDSRVFSPPSVVAFKTMDNIIVSVEHTRASAYLSNFSKNFNMVNQEKMEVVILPHDLFIELLTNHMKFGIYKKDIIISLL